MLVTVPILSASLKMRRGAVSWTLKFLRQIGVAQPTETLTTGGRGRPVRVWKISETCIPSIRGTPLDIADRFQFPTIGIHATLRTLKEMGFAKRVDRTFSGAVIWQIEKKTDGREENTANGESRLPPPGLPGA